RPQLNGRRFPSNLRPFTFGDDLRLRQGLLWPAMKLPRPLEGLNREEIGLLLVLGPGSFVTASTIGTINVGLPAIQHEFGVSFSALKWVSIMGSIMMATLSLCFGRIGDIYGRKLVYRTGILVYAVGSGLAAAAVSFPMLIAVRIFTALGIAMSLP